MLDARVRARTGRCRCGSLSGRVHGRYVRDLRDGAIGGLGVTIVLQVRRFRCLNLDCPAVTFAEQVPDLTSPHSRFTPLLRRWLTAVGLALAGRAGARLAAVTGTAVSRDTLLRLVRSAPDPMMGTVRTLGVDDFAFRRGRRYGTVLIDLETRRPIDLFDGRDGETLADWLAGHRDVRTICRDRSGGYAEGARQGAPQAIQVADRFHIWRNLGDAVEKSVNSRRAQLKDQVQESLPTIEAPPMVQPLPEKKIVTRFREQHAAATELFAQGMTKAAIGRKLGLHQATVRKLVNATSVDDLIAKTEQRAHLVDDYVAHLHRRWNDGQRNATQLFREIQDLGYPGGELAVQRYLRRFRTGRGHAPEPGPKPPSVREVTAWIMTDPEHLNDDDTAALDKICRRDPDLQRLTAHVSAFAIMMTGLHGDRLDEWITNVENDTLSPLAAFARNLRRDYDAVRNGLTLPHNSGPVEGAINRLKMLKRQMFGRANLDLLRKRVLYA